MFLLLNIPFIQQKISATTSKELSAFLNSKVNVGKLEIGFPNRIILTDLAIDDLSGNNVIMASRVSATYQLLPLLRGDFYFRSIQLFEPSFQIKKTNPQSPTNLQFLIDALSSDNSSSTDNTKIQINNFLIRRGQLKYDVLSVPPTMGKLDQNHLNLDKITANITLKHLSSDSINLGVKRMAFVEKNSDFELKRIDFKTTINNRQLLLEGLTLELPRSKFLVDTLKLVYPGFDDLRALTHHVKVDFTINSPRFTPGDISVFLPLFAHFNESVSFELYGRGSLERLEIPLISLSTDKHFHIQGDALIGNIDQSKDLDFNINLVQAYADSVGIDFLTQNLNVDSNLPAIVNKLGTVSMNGLAEGTLQDFTTSSKIKTKLGIIETNIKIQDKDDSYMGNGTISTDNFSLGTLLSNKDLGNVALSLHLSGNNFQSKEKRKIKMDGEIPFFEFKNYKYNDTRFDGSYENKELIGNLQIADNNADVLLQAKISNKQTPKYYLKAFINRIRPTLLHLISREDDCELSGKLVADVEGEELDDLIGTVQVDELIYTSNNTSTSIDHFKINSKPHENYKYKEISVESDFMQGFIKGDISYKGLPNSILSLMHQYVPHFAREVGTPKISKNNFEFNFKIHNTDMVAALFNIPIKIYTTSNINGYINDRTQRVRIEGYFPHLRYNDVYLESGSFICENPDDALRSIIHFTKHNSIGSTNLTAEAIALNDSLITSINWGNNGNITYSGKLATVAHFDQQKTVIDINPTDIIIKDSLWNISKSQITVDQGKYFINNFSFSKENRHLLIDGVLSKSKEDSLFLDLRGIDIGYVFDIADLGVRFDGEATGQIVTCGILKEPYLFSKLFIHNFGTFEHTIGDANIEGEWHNDIRGLAINADIEESNISHTRVNGYIYPLKPEVSLDLNLKADNLNVNFLHYFMSEITPDFHGRVSGNARLYGKFKALNLEGKVNTDAYMKIAVLNTTFHMQDSITMTTGGIRFQNNRLLDPSGNQGIFNGQLRYQNFKNLQYDFNINLNKMLILNTTASPDWTFYGTVFATGNGTIVGNDQDGLNINATITTNDNSSFTFIKDGVTTATTNQFIQFVDKTPTREKPLIVLKDYEIDQQKKQDTVTISNNFDTDIRLNLNVDVTPAATLKIIMDPISGDHISAHGSGNIRAEYYNKGDIVMYGGFNISQGIYKLSIQEVIRKDFTIQEGSSINFSGDPLEASLDIRTLYQVMSASLNDLIPNANSYVDKTNVRVNCLMNLSGQLTSPTVSMEITLPQESDEVQALMRNYISTSEEMSMQMLYLLGIGKFYTPENVQTGQTSDRMSSMVSSTLNGQLNNALSNIINSNNWNIGTNLSTGIEGWNDMEIEGILSGQLLNNRLLINGNFGYRDNTTTISNTNFIGDFDAEFLVNPSGDIRLKAYNKTNDRYYMRSNQTQGVGIIFKKDFDGWSDVFKWNRWKLRRLKKNNENKSEENDN